MSTIVGFHNLLDTARVEASSSPALHPVEDGFDYVTTDYWQPEGPGPWDVHVDTLSPAKADYLGIVWEPGATVEVACRLPGSDDYSRLVSETPATSVVVIPFAARAAQHWRVRFTGVAAPKIAHLSVGRRLTLPVKLQTPFTEPKRAQLEKVENSVTQGGHFAGRSVVRRGLSFDLDLKLLEAGWVDAHWPAWREHMEAHGPFFLLWDASHRRDDAAFLWARDLTKLSGPRHSHPMYSDLALDLEGMV